MAATACGNTVGMGLNPGPVLDSLPQATSRDARRQDSDREQTGGMNNVSAAALRAASE